MLNKILIGTGIIAGIAHNVHDMPGAFWIFELCFILFLWQNRRSILEWLAE